MFTFLNKTPNANTILKSLDNFANIEETKSLVNYIKPKLINIDFTPDSEISAYMLAIYNQDKKLNYSEISNPNYFKTLIDDVMLLLDYKRKEFVKKQDFLDLQHIEIDIVDPFGEIKVKDKMISVFTLLKHAKYGYELKNNERIFFTFKNQIDERIFSYFIDILIHYPINTPTAFFIYNLEHSSIIVQDITRFLKSGSSPKHFQIDFENCQIGDSEAKSLATALESGKTNDGLLISFGKSNIRLNGFESLAKAIGSGNCPEGLFLTFQGKSLNVSFDSLIAGIRFGKAPRLLTLEFEDLQEEHSKYLANIITYYQTPEHFGVNLKISATQAFFFYPAHEKIITAAYAKSNDQYFHLTVDLPFEKLILLAAKIIVDSINAKKLSKNLIANFNLRIDSKIYDKDKSSQLRSDLFLLPILDALRNNMKQNGFTMTIQLDELSQPVQEQIIYLVENPSYPEFEMNFDLPQQYNFNPQFLEKVNDALAKNTKAMIRFSKDGIFEDYSFINVFTRRNQLLKKYPEHSVIIQAMSLEGFYHQIELLAESKSISMHNFFANTYNDKTPRLTVDDISQILEACPDEIHDFYEELTSKGDNLSAKSLRLK